MDEGLPHRPRSRGAERQDRATARRGFTEPLGANPMIAKSVVLSILILQTVGCATTGKECTPPVPPSDKVSELIVYLPSLSYSSNYDTPISIADCIVVSLEDVSLICSKIA